MAALGSSPPRSWPAIASLLGMVDLQPATTQYEVPDAAGPSPSVARRFPEPEITRGFAAQLAAEHPAAAQRLVAASRGWQASERLAACPIVAVAGLLNSGKTSLVAALLGDSGRARALRGDANREGTHRFVLWLPAAWRNAEIWELLVERLTDCLGAAPEMLADAAADAHAQYNNRGGTLDTLAVPLVGFDEGLEQHGVGLLDCPDIQTGSVADHQAATRRDFLSRAAGLCSAFLVVSAYHALRDRTLSDILQLAQTAMPACQRVLAINRIRPRYAPHEVLADVQPLLAQHRITRCLIAYDYELPGSEQWIPASATDESAGEQVPQFFQPHADPTGNPPHLQPPERDRLSGVLAGLERSHLLSGLRESLDIQLRRSIWQGVHAIEGADRESARLTADLHARAMDVALEFFAKRDATGRITELRLHQSRPIQQQLEHALRETAPWYMRSNLALQRWFGSLQRVSQAVRDVLPARRIQQQVRDALQSGREGRMVNAAQLRGTIERYDIPALCPAWSQSNVLDEAAACVVERFEREDRTELEDRQLSEVAQRVWHDLPRGQKIRGALVAPGVLAAAMVAAILIPIDFGGTAVVVYASIPELLAAAGLASGIAAWSGRSLLQSLQEQAAGAQLANFVAILCDCLGAPRPERLELISPGRERAELPPARAAVRTRQPPAWSWWRLRPEFRRELTELVPPPESA